MLHDRDMTDLLDDPRPVFATAARSLASVVHRIRPDQWELHALGEWDVRSLVGHALRGVTTAPTYLATPADEITVHSVAEYFRFARSAPELHAGVAERGRAAGVELGDDPAAVVDAAVEESVAVVSSTPLDATLTMAWGTMRLREYLATRVIEVTVHTDDICQAIGIDHVASPEESQLVLEALVSVAGSRDGMSVIRAVLGRESLPDGFNLWG
jgi:uncharacterized protein (TIGR03083 family)